MRRLPLILIACAACGDNLPGPEVTDDAGPGDSGPGTIRLEFSAPSAESGAITVTAKRTGGSDGAVSVAYTTDDDAAIAGADFTATSGTFSWDDGDASDQTAEIPILDDLMVEGPETLVVDLAAPTGNALLAETTYFPSINDDDRVANATVLTSGQRIATFDLEDPATLRSTATITGLAAAETILGIDIRPSTGTLYGVSSAGALYTIDRATGFATFEVALAADATDASAPFTGLTGTAFGVDFNPVPDRLRVVSNTGQNLRINVDTGATTTDTAITGVATGYDAVAYTNSFSAACRTALYGLDTANSRLVLQSPPNDGVSSTVGALGVTVTGVRGFDIVTDLAVANTAVALLDVGTTTGLYTIDLTTGAAAMTATLTLPAGETAVDLSVVIPAGLRSQPRGELNALTASGKLISFTQATPTKLCSSVAISGAISGSTLHDLDYRPSTGALHVLGSVGTTGTLYTVDPASGVASTPTTLTTALSGTRFAMDFNPTGPVALRIVSDTGQNLRVTDVATGATTADGALNGAATGARGAGYTDSLPGAGTTTLYVIDTVNDRLRIQNPPNAGTLVDVAALGVNLDAVMGFDVDGRDNQAFIAGRVGTAATSSTLYTMNMLGGDPLVSVGTIAGGELVVGLARAPRTATVFALTSAGQLETFSTATPGTVTTIGTITGLATNETLIGIDVRPSTNILYGMGNLGGLYSINTTTAVATPVSSLAADPADATAPFTSLAGQHVGFDFNPTGVVALRVVSDSGENLRIVDVNAGLVTTDATINRTAPDYSVSAVAYANNTVASASTALYGLDDVSDKLVAIAPPNAGVVREIGALGVDVGVSAHFEIINATTAIAIVQAAVDPTLVSIDLTTGAATTIGNVDVASGIAAMAAPISPDVPAASSTVFAVTGLGTLIRFPRNAPGTLTNLGTISGLIVGDVVVGIDARPDASSNMWLLARNAVTGAGNLYTLNTATAAATFVATLSADAADTTSAYTVLPLPPLAMDFNPTGAVPLRVIASTGENLRVTNPSTGATFTDTALTAPGTDLVAAAYTNSYSPLVTAGAALPTTLYVIDAASGTLFTQSPPNNGTLNLIGALSPSSTFTGTGGVAGGGAFDIAGGQNGVALAALQRTTGTPLAAESLSRLYRINLATGAATELGTGIGGAPVTGLAIRVQ